MWKDARVYWLVIAVAFVPTGCSDGGTATSQDAGTDSGIDGSGGDDGRPGVPSGIVAEPADRAVRLSWTPGAGENLAGHRVWWGTSEQSMDESVFVDAPENTVEIGGLENWTEYFFSFQAESCCNGNSEPSDPVAATPRPELVPPADFTGIPGDGRIDFYWTHDENAGVAAYRLHWGTSEDQLDQVEDIQVRAGGTASLSGLDNGVSIFFALEAEFESGERSFLSPVGRAMPTEAELNTPQVVEVTPQDGQADVALDTLIAVRFDQPMDADTVSVTIEPVHALGIGQWSQEIDEVVFGPVLPLAEATSYTLNVAGESQHGIELGGQVKFTFTTVSDPIFTEPQIDGMSPPAGAVDVTPATRIVVGFTEPMNTDSVADHFSTNPDIPCAFEWDKDKTAYTCTPANPLLENTSYAVRVTEGALDAQGHPLVESYSASFVTGLFRPSGEYPPRLVAHLPQEGAVGVDTWPEIKLAFSEPMDRAWTQAAFRVESPEVPGGSYSWNEDGTIMTYTLPGCLEHGTEVTWRVTDGARDLDGDSLEEEVSGHFRVVRLETVYLPSQPELDGVVNDQGQVDQDNVCIYPGFVSKQDAAYVARGLVSFDLSALPEDMSRIVQAVFRNHLVDIVGEPYQNLGWLKLTRVQYGDTLDAADFDLMAVPFEACPDGECDDYTGYYMAYSHPQLLEIDMTPAIQADWDNRWGQGRRAQYQYHFGHDDEAGDLEESAYIVLLSGDAYQGCGAGLILKYEVP